MVDVARWCCPPIIHGLAEDRRRALSALGAILVLSVIQFHQFRGFSEEPRLTVSLWRLPPPVTARKSAEIVSTHRCTEATTKNDKANFKFESLDLSVCFCVVFEWVVRSLPITDDMTSDHCNFDDFSRRKQPYTDVQVARRPIDTGRCCSLPNSVLRNRSVGRFVTKIHRARRTVSIQPGGDGSISRAVRRRLHRRRRSTVEPPTARMICVPVEILFDTHIAHFRRISRGDKVCARSDSEMYSMKGNRDRLVEFRGSTAVESPMKKSKRSGGELINIQSHTRRRVRQRLTALLPPKKFTVFRLNLKIGIICGLRAGNQRRKEIKMKKSKCRSGPPLDTDGLRGKSGARVGKTAAFRATP
ncbi:hypothetical protein Q1695_013550 [Nippostrongylus brasiliensis]|nr:hypothetical protein Q1695_013550 [Nippostrongylus brasiliensis]